MTTQSFTIQEVNSDLFAIDIYKLMNNKKRSRSFEEKNHEPPLKLMKLQEGIAYDTKNPAEILMAYKRIWNNLDLNKAVDAKLEPFVWSKIRYYQQILKQ